MYLALSYSCIAPLVLGFATLAVSLLYVVFRYNVFYAFGSKVDTTGHMYNRALQQLMTGIYISELCLIGFFSLRTAFGPLVIMIVFLCVTAVYHFAMNMVRRTSIGRGPLSRCIGADFDVGSWSPDKIISDIRNRSRERKPLCRATGPCA